MRASVASQRQVKYNTPDATARREIVRCTSTCTTSRQTQRRRRQQSVASSARTSGKRPTRANSSTVLFSSSRSSCRCVVRSGENDTRRPLDDTYTRCARQQRVTVSFSVCTACFASRAHSVARSCSVSHLAPAPVVVTGRRGDRASSSGGTAAAHGPLVRRTARLRTSCGREGERWS